MRMRALCLITTRPGKADAVAGAVRRKRRVVRDAMVVAGRADVCAVLQGTMDEINAHVIDLKRVRDIVTTETLVEVEVSMDW